MSALVFTLLRIGFLALLWIFVLAVLMTLRRDVYGTQVKNRGVASSSSPPQQRSRRKATQAKSSSQHEQQAGPTQPTLLTVTAGPLAGTTLPLGSAQIIVGRSPDSALVLDDTYSSARHARFYQSDGAWWVEDLDSTNGTYVGGQRISMPRQIAPGIPVVIGRTTMELR